MNSYNDFEKKDSATDQHSTLKQFLSHDSGPIAQFFKYAIAGGVATAVNILVFYIFGWRLLPCLTENDFVAVTITKLTGWKAAVAVESMRATFAIYCNIIAFFFSNTVCYILNRIFVFKPGRHSAAVEFLLFFVVSAVSIITGTAIQTWLINAFGMQTTIAFGANLVTSLAINYVMRRFVVFKG